MVRSFSVSWEYSKIISIVFHPLDKWSQGIQCQMQYTNLTRRKKNGIESGNEKHIPDKTT